MGNLAESDLAQGRMTLEATESTKAAKLLTVGVTATNGGNIPTIEARYGVAQSTFYYWLDRLETLA